MFRSTLLVAMLSLLTMAGLANSPSVHAQTIILLSPEMTQPDASAYSEDELEQFAGAALSVQRINEDVMPKLEAASSREEVQQLAQTASMEMMQAVEARGMSVDRFQEILYQAQTNPEVGERVVQHLQALQQYF